MGKRDLALAIELACYVSTWSSQPIRHQNLRSIERMQRNRVGCVGYEPLTIWRSARRANAMS